MRLRRVGETPRLVWGAMRFVWQAGRGQLLVTMGLQFLMAAALALQVFLGTRVLGNLLAVTANRGNAARLIPELLALLVVTAVSQFAAAAQSGYQRLLSDRVLRHAQDRIIDVATA
ncbi:MAG TPA: hypothetical protein VE219_02345, partial [Candidatus Sulfotelmatobacter sp.]|nr:hypothetical protein [Candidatus Sulfotelmatobacter sp.]